MAKGRNRNNQAANPPENIEESTDAEFLEHEDQVALSALSELLSSGKSSILQKKLTELTKSELWQMDLEMKKLRP